MYMNHDSIIWPKDKNGKEMVPGMTAIHPEGLQGKLVIAHYALRIDIWNGDNLDKNSTLVCSDRHQPTDFEVIIEDLNG